MFAAFRNLLRSKCLWSPKSKLNHTPGGDSKGSHTDGNILLLSLHVWQQPGAVQFTAFLGPIPLSIPTPPLYPSS